MGVLEWLGLKRISKEEKEKEKAEKDIKGYELYDKPAGQKWVKLLDMEKPVDFEELEDAMPGHTYKLQVRYTNGTVRQIWYRHLQGATGERVIDPFDQMERALAPMVKFGEQISGLRDTIQGAFGWAFPQQPEGGSTRGNIVYKGDIPAYLHPLVPEGLGAWGPVFKEWTKSITSGLREGLGAEEKEETEEVEAAVEFKKPSPRPEDYLQQEGPEQEAE